MSTHKIIPRCSKRVVTWYTTDSSVPFVGAARLQQRWRRGRVASECYSPDRFPAPRGVWAAMLARLWRWRAPPGQSHSCSALRAWYRPRHRPAPPPFYTAPRAATCRQLGWINYLQWRLFIASVVVRAPLSLLYLSLSPICSSIYLHVFPTEFRSTEIATKRFL